MKKYEYITGAACPFHSASSQAKNWTETKIAYMVVTDDGRVFIRDKDMDSYRARRKWVEKPMHRTTAEGFISYVNARPANFRGGPKS